ncbi:MAG: hypothetical protein ACPF9D_06190 [Owenweeksia sp.]
MKKKVKHSFLRSFTLVFLTGAVTACNWLGSGGKEDREPVARVYDRYLYKEDIESIVPSALKGNDSIAFIQNYIGIWAKDQLMLYKAEYNLTEQQKDFEQQITDYRNDLLKFAYQQEYVRQNLDTNISDTEVEAYYERNGDNFELKENILKARYMVVNANAPKISNARDWFRSEKPDDFQKVKEYALKYASEFSLEDTSWVSFDLLASKFPIETYNQSEFLANNKYVELTKNGKLYLLKIVSYKIKEGKSPLTYVKDVIRNILINQRKLELLANLEKNLLDDALDKKEFETY